MNTTKKPPRKNIYNKITDLILDDLKQGTRPWFKPWRDSPENLAISKPLRANGKPYKGVNILMLWSAAADHCYNSPTWMTYRQAKKLGGQVRKGEKSESIVYVDTFTKKETDPASGDEISVQLPFLETYQVFNADQIDGLPAIQDDKQKAVVKKIEPIQLAENFFKATGMKTVSSGNHAYYSPTLDVVQLPLRKQFRDAQSYYATLAHESVHRTGHSSRLARDFGAKSWGDEGYAKEELVAELGSAFLAADLGLSIHPRKDHASYLASWLKVLEGDKKAIFNAAAHAQRATDFLHVFQRHIHPELTSPAPDL